jgi:hypothetical protein
MERHAKSVLIFCVGSLLQGDGITFLIGGVAWLCAFGLIFQSQSVPRMPTHLLLWFAYWSSSACKKK